ncbi:integrase core domain-containing protein [Amycolatopsis jiangsuensis]|uniref:integrase core domain-containing protein n=1 Tax=Amycolatopsis jiangsuensis TaxID=1181879 RepID=UPI0028AE4B1F|nr:integrase core domain-containing protein [Amycolatopsis jiangsuensis]
MLRRPIEPKQYSSAVFRGALDTLDTLGIRPPMGSVSSCYDNTGAESTFATLKTEIGTHVWATRDGARRAVFTYLGYDNHNRLHSAIDYRTAHENRVSCRQDPARTA